MTVDRAGFCRSLREARLGRALTLEAIAESSKIGVSLLVDLERGDFSRWPKGIFRRAFLREYAATIGLAPEQIVSDAGRLFPEDGGDALEADRSELGPEGLRMTLAPDRRWWLAPTAQRGLAACLDVMAVLLAGGIIARLASGNLQLVTAVVGLTYYGAATACAGATPASLWLSRRGRLTPRRWGADSFPAVVERPRLVFRGPGPSTPALAESHDAAPAARESLRAASQ